MTYEVDLWFRIDCRNNVRIYSWKISQMKIEECYYSVKYMHNFL